MQAIIVSKDRACQLDALLQSIVKYAPQLQPYIIYTASSPKYLDAYRIVQAEYNWCHFYLEDGFKNTIMQALTENNSKCVCLLTDDSIFYNNLLYTDNSLNEMFQRTKCWTFSPRCGLNTQQQCHWMPIFQEPIEIIYQEDNMMMWNFTKHSYSNDYGRPVSLDGNINSREKLVPQMSVENWNWCGGLDGICTEPFLPYMSSYKHSILTNIPVNSTHGNKTDNWGKFVNQSFEELNNKFLSGLRVNIEKMDFSHVIGGHQEIEYII